MKEPKYNSQTGRHEIDGVPFDGHFREWRFEFVPKTYLKESELSGNEYRKGGNARIYLNGDCVLDQFWRDENSALLFIGGKLLELQDFFFWKGLPFSKTWKEEIIGKKIYHAGVPSIVDSYCGNGEIIVKTEDGKDYEIYGHKKEANKNENDYQDEWKDKDRVHITDMRLTWYRT